MERFLEVRAEIWFTSRERLILSQIIAQWTLICVTVPQ